MKKTLLLVVAVIFVTALMGTPASAAEVTHTPCVGAVTSNSARVVVRTDVAASVYIKYSVDSLTSKKDEG